MIDDIRLILWKELKDFTGDLRHRKRSTIIVILTFISILALIVSGAVGDAWFDAMAYMIWTVFPMVFISTMVTDSFAGERERHTLESLLATRLSDRAIFYGKVFAPVILIWSAIQIWMLTGAVVVNVIEWNGTIQFFTLPTLVIGLLICFVSGTFMSTIGSLISLYAETVKIAQTRFGMAFLILMVLMFVPLLLLPLLSESTRNAIIDWFINTDPNTIMLIALIIMTALTFGLMQLGLRWFQRERMILN